MRRSGAGEEQAAASQTAINELKLEWQAVRECGTGSD